MKTALILLAAATLALLAVPASASDRHTSVRVMHVDHTPYSVVRYRHEPEINIYIGPRIRYEPFGVYRVIPRVDHRYYEDRYDRRFERRYERREERREDWRDERRHDNRRDWDDRHRDDRSRRNHYK